MTIPPPGLSPPIGFAHRGARSERRENTLDAFSRALELGATGLESDAWITADGVVVLDHDGVTGPIWRRRAISTQNRSDLPRHIPSLEELYAECGTDFELSLDVKDAAALNGVIAVARAAGTPAGADGAVGAGAVGRLWLCHHDWRQMAGWRRVAPEPHLVESTNIAWMPEGLASRAAALADAGIGVVNMHRGQWDASRVAAVHAAGLAAFAWGAQSNAEIEEVLDYGMDGIYSDHVGRLMQTIRARASGG